MSVHRSAPPRKPGPDSARPRWRRWLLRGALAGFALLLVIGVPMVWVLDKQVRSEFDQLAWQVPTRVYARPLLLKPEQMSWQQDGEVLTLSFFLPAGAFATSVVRELMQAEEADHGFRNPTDANSGQ